MKDAITIALSKGRLLDEALLLLKKADIEIAESNLNSRKLVAAVAGKILQLLKGIALNQLKLRFLAYTHIGVLQ